MRKIAIVGTGYVADLYMRSLQTFPEIEIVAAFDRRPEHLQRFCSHWGIAPASSLDEVLRSDAVLILNLTNPRSHYEVSKACLEAGKNVYSEKPLAMNMDEARSLHQFAAEKGLHLACAPCNSLSQSCQAAWLAIRKGEIGRPLLVYAELDDGFISQAPRHLWRSESGAEWPYQDEVEVGCTLEHAGYYLSWLIMMFGSVKVVVSCAAEVVPNKLPGNAPCAPDYTSASLIFENGVVARLTCSIAAPHDHRFRVFGEKGYLEVDDCWNNAAKVKIRRRMVIRRKLFYTPFPRTFAIRGKTHPMVSKRGAAAMNFALGPAEVLAACIEGRSSRLNADFSLHLNEVVLAIQNAGSSAGAQHMETKCPPIQPMPWAA